MKKYLSFSSVIFVLLLLACSTVPVSNRQRLNFISDAQINSLSFQEYQTFLTQNNASINKNSQQVTRVRQIGARIQTAVEQYMAQEGMSDQIASFSWEFNVVEDNQVNAWAMPGGKVVVYSGIFETAQTDEGLATVIAHEIAHAVAKHGAERMSQQMLLEAGSYAMNNSGLSEMYQQAFAIGSQYAIVLPYSRKHEYEADHLGLIFIAMAGYNPQSAVAFWQRMSAGGQEVPEFLSTHPCDENRIASINQLMPEAMRYYQNSQFK